MPEMYILKVHWHARKCQWQNPAVGRIRNGLFSIKTSA